MDIALWLPSTIIGVFGLGGLVVLLQFVEDNGGWDWGDFRLWVLRVRDVATKGERDAVDRRERDLRAELRSANETTEAWQQRAQQLERQLAESLDDQIEF